MIAQRAKPSREEVLEAVKKAIAPFRRPHADGKTYEASDFYQAKLAARRAVRRLLGRHKVVVAMFHGARTLLINFDNETLKINHEFEPAPTG